MIWMRFCRRLCTPVQRAREADGKERDVQATTLSVREHLYDRLPLEGSHEDSKASVRENTTDMTVQVGVKREA